MQIPMNRHTADQHGSMQILVAEDEELISDTYQIALEDRGHTVTITSDGNEALGQYKKRLNVQVHDKKQRMQEGTFPFDVVILDYRMPGKDGIQVAKEILELNPNQRIIFASAYVRDTLMQSVKALNQVVELLQKPFELDVLIDTVEDRLIYEELCNVNEGINNVEQFNPTHKQLQEMLKGVQKIRRNNVLVSALSDTP